MVAQRSIRFVYDVVCPFAYLAFRQLSRIRVHAEVELHPVLLGGLLRHAGGPDDPNTVMAPARAAVNRRDFEAWSDFWGVPLHVPAGHPRRSVDAMRVLCSADAEQREAWTATLYDAYWQRGEDIADRDVLRRVMAAHDVDVDAAIEAGRDALRASTQAAFDAGAFGVPTFLGGPRLLWGQDRIGLLLRDLGAPLHPDAWAEPAATSPRRVTGLRFAHDFASPFSYLASTQVERLAAEAGLSVEWSPILLGALFRAIGTPNVPLHAMNPARQAYARRDIADWADAWGVPMRFPSHFPMRSVLPLRASLVEPRATAAIYRAAWAEDRRVDTPETLGPVLEEAGFDAAGILARTADPEVKAALRENTERAQAEGVCGVPTVVLTYDDGSTLRLWGQDRLVMVRAALRGWMPPVASR
ncbi:MAG: 2-hydroxychromene-2-carboxylate isomerase [Nannocystaceae bacterium]|nr:DsbA family protein [bacterium]